MTFAYWREYGNCLVQEQKPSDKLQEHVNTPRSYRSEWKTSIRNIQPQLEAEDLQTLYSQECELKLKIEGSRI